MYEEAFPIAWQSGNDIHDLCGRPLWCWWSLFCGYCIRYKVVFHNITSENSSTFVFLFCLQFSIFRWYVSINGAKWTLAPFVLASSITSFLLLTFVRFHAEIFSNFSHSLSTAAFAWGIFIAWGIRINLCTKSKCWSELSPSPAMRSSW